MKLKITSTYAVAATAVAIFLSACGSNVTVSKRYHSSGFNFAWGGGSDGDKSATKAIAKKPTIKKVGKSTVTSSEMEGVVASGTAVNNTTAAYAEKASVVASQSSLQNNQAGAGVVAGTKSFDNTGNKAVAKSAVTAKQAVKSAKASSGPGKSQIVALILAIFVGVIGVHRFYLGYPMEGVLQILTAGGCGIWTLIDIIRIITGDLQPADGEYEETL